MGNQNSSASSGRQTPVRTCYYDLLEVDQNCTSDEIKKGYRRKALELHPDKNINDAENATRRFAEVQAAYEILSDPQERAWYDSHREAILHGLDGEDGGTMAPEYRNVRITSTEEILALVGRFNSTVPFSDEPTGFFGRLREMFGHLAAEEMAAGDYCDTEPVPYPSFGTSSDDYESVVKPFYSRWLGFSTRKMFAWKDKYRLSDAPDRRVRRLMEKENKKCRDDAIREFNDAVRFLVTFARKRDPRYLPNTQSNADRQKALRDVVAAQAARSKAAQKEKLADSPVPEWAQSRAGPRDEANMDEEFSASSQDDSELEQIECVICDKTFKSEKQYQAHERSKKHVKAVQQLRREMRKDGVELGLDLDESADGYGPGPDQGADVNAGSSDATEMLKDEMPTNPGDFQPQIASDTSDSSPNTTTYEDEDYVRREMIEKRLVQSSPSKLHAAGGELAEATESAALDQEEPAPRKLGKAKAKREKRAARQAATETGGKTTTCANCGEPFASKNRLFSHIREVHSTPPGQRSSKSANKRNK